jgi:hypothetical protein
MSISSSFTTALGLSMSAITSQSASSTRLVESRRRSCPRTKQIREARSPVHRPAAALRSAMRAAPPKCKVCLRPLSIVNSICTCTGISLECYYRLALTVSATDRLEQSRLSHEHIKYYPAICGTCTCRWGDRPNQFLRGWYGLTLWSLSRRRLRYGSIWAQLPVWQQSLWHSAHNIYSHPH